MGSVALYRRYRPQTFEDVLGQGHVTDTLQRSIKDGRIAHAFLFSGSRGTGKTSTARILAKALNCEKGPTPTPCNECETCKSITEGNSLDVIEIDAASHGGVDDVRELRENALLAPALARRKIYIIDEAHMVSNQGWNAFLKTVEEPPEHVIFVFATTEPHKVLPTILSRCQRFDFRRISSATIAEHLGRVSKEEGVEADEGALQLIARHAEGGARDALSILDQLSSAGAVTMEATARLLGSATGDTMFTFVTSLADGDTAAAVHQIARLVEEGQDLRVFARGVVEHLRALLFAQTIDEPGDLIDATEETLARLAAQGENITPAKLVQFVRLFVGVLTEVRQQASPRLSIEMAIVRATMPEVDDSAAGAIARIERLERRLFDGVQPIPAAIVQAPTPAAGKSKPASPVSKEPAKTAPAEAVVEKTAPPSKVEAGSPAPAAEVVPEPEPVPVAGSLEIEAIRRSWPMILEEVRKRSKRLYSMLTEASVRSMDGNVLTLEAKFPFHADQFMARENMGELSQAVKAILGIAPRINATAAAAKPVAAVEDINEIDEARIEEPSHDAMDNLRAAFGDDIETE